MTCPRRSTRRRRRAAARRVTAAGAGRSRRADGPVPAGSTARPRRRAAQAGSRPTELGPQRRHRVEQAIALRGHSLGHAGIPASLFGALNSPCRARLSHSSRRHAAATRSSHLYDEPAPDHDRFCVAGFRHGRAAVQRQGAPGRIRTRDRRIRSPLLIQLSYEGLAARRTASSGRRGVNAQCRTSWRHTASPGTRPGSHRRGRGKRTPRDTAMARSRWS